MRIKRIISMFLAIISVVTLLSFPLRADTYIGSKDKKEGGFLGIGGTTYTYRYYQRWTQTRYWYGKPVSPVGYYTQYSGGGSCTVARTVTLAWSTTKSYNNSVGGNVGIPELIGLTASAGYGTTYGMTFSTAKYGDFQRNIKDSAKTGYYLLAPAQTEHACKWKKYSNNNTVDTGKSGTYYMPYGPSVIVMCYNPNNANWYIC